MAGERSRGASSCAPIFVVGYQRSGTTLLQTLLASHPNIAAPPEMYFIHRIVRQKARYGDLSDDRNLRRVIDDLLSPTLPTLAGCGFDPDALFARARRGPATYAAVFDVIMSDFAARHGKARWSEKTPGQPARSILQLFPDAKLVHIVRDPRAVIASSLATPWNPFGARQRAEFWRRFTRDNIATGFAAGPERFFQIRYEDLTRDPEHVMRLVFTFLGEDFDPSMIAVENRAATAVPDVTSPWQLRALEPIAPPDFNAWRSKLGRRDRAHIAAVLNSDLKPLGYQPDRGRVALAGRVLGLAPDSATIRRVFRGRNHMQRALDRLEEHERERAARVYAANADVSEPPGATQASELVSS